EGATTPRVCSLRACTEFRPPPLFLRPIATVNMLTQGTSLFARAAGVVMPKPQPAHPTLQFSYPLPYGAILHDEGVQFVVYSRSATAMRVLLYNRVSDREPSQVIEFDPATDRWGDIWSVIVPGLKAGTLYHFQADGPYDPQRGL